MATTENFYTGGSGTTTFGFSFPILQNSDLKVELDGVLKTENTSGTNNDYSISNTNVVFNSAPASGVDIHLYRVTDVDTVAPVFVSGSAIRAQDLNSIADKTFYSNQEQHQKIKTADVRDGSITTAKIKADNIVGSLIADDAIDSEHIAADSLDSEHYAPNSVDSTAIGASQVTANELATDAVNESKILNGAVTVNKIGTDAVNGSKIADNSIDSEHYVDGSIDTEHLADGAVNANKIAAGSITVSQLGNNSVLTAQVQDGQITSAKLHPDTVITSSEQGSATTNDTSFLTSAAADARFFNVSSGDTIKDGDTFPDNDTTIATTAAINDRIIDLIDDVGGFVPIANETSFPAANPDVNNGAGTIVSIKALTNAITTGSGVTTKTIANGAGTGNTVTITGLTASTTYPAGMGMLVETTSTLHTYSFHRLVPKATEVSTVAGISGNVTTVAGISANTTTVAGISSDVTTVAGIASNVTAVAGNNTNITAVKNNETNINAVQSNASNINTVAGSITNVNNVGNSIASVNTAASNLTSINKYGDQYQVASSNPDYDGGGNQLAEGDLYFNTTANELKVYNGSAWVSGVTQTGNFALTTGNSFSGDNTYVDNAKARFGTGQDLEIFHNTNDSVINDTGDGTLKLQTGGNTKLEIQSGGIGVTGNITVSGNVDGRDLAVDGAKLDNIEANATADQTANDVLNLLSDQNIATTGRVDAADVQVAGTVFHEGDTDTKLEFGNNQMLLKTGGTTRFEANNSNLMVRSGFPLGFSSSSGNSPNIKSGNTNNQHLLFTVDNTERFEVNNTGVDVTGNITVSGTVDGRDVASDGTKLDGIEAGATADQTAEEIQDIVGAMLTGNTETGITATYQDGDGTIDFVVASQTDNNFTTTLKNKLDGITASATANPNALDNVVEDSSPQLGGDLQSNSHDIKIADATGYDGNNIYMGTDADCRIHHDGSNFSIAEATGDVTITAADDIFLKPQNGASGIEVRGNAAVKLFHSGSEKLQTQGDGIYVTGKIQPTSHIYQNDNLKHHFGSSQDLSIYHQGGGHNYIDASSGNIYLRVNSTENAIKCTLNGNVEISNNGSKKFETSDYGVHVTGSASGNSDTHSAGTVTIDTSSAAYHYVTASGACSFAAPINTQNGHTGSIFITQSGSGGAGSWNSVWKWTGNAVPTLSSGSGKVDRIDYIVKSSTEIHAVASLAVGG